MSTTPLVGDLALDAVTWIRHRCASRWASQAVIGLEGDLQQRLGRASHEIDLAGVIHGDDALTALEELQAASVEGNPVPFTADITTALALQQVIVVAAEFEAEAGRPDLYVYRLYLREAPPVPPPLELDPFGGLSGFDLGFDLDILDDVLAAADALQDAIELADGLLDKLDALTGLAGLAVGNPLEPIQDSAKALGSAGADAPAAAGALTDMLGDTP